MGFGIDNVKSVLGEADSAVGTIPGSKEALAKQIGNSLPSLPLPTPMPKYPSIKHGIACKEVVLKYNIKILKLRISHMTAWELSKALAAAISPIIDVYMELEDALNIDLTTDGVGSSPSGAGDKLPECLEKFSSSGEMIDKAVSSVSSLLDSETVGAISGMLKEIDMFADKVLLVINSAVEDVNNLVNELSTMIGNMHDNIIFPLVQTLEEFINSSLYAADIQELLEMKKCLESNCKPGVSSMMDLDGIIYNDGNSAKGFTIPIEPGNGQVKIGKLYNINPKLDKPHTKDSLRKVERRYINWKREKQKAQDVVKKNVGNSLGSELYMDDLPGMGANAGDIFAQSNDLSLFIL
jgi:hypothetical protein